MRKLRPRDDKATLRRQRQDGHLLQLKEVQMASRK